MNPDCLSPGHLHPDRERNTLCKVFLDLVPVEHQTATIIPGRHFRAFLLLSHFLQSFGCAEAVVRAPLGKELLHVSPVDGKPLGLNIRAERTAYPGAFVVVQARPSQGFD